MSEDFPDPPTPQLDASTNPNISLSNDLASLLDSLNLMLPEHLEVGHHLGILFRNVDYSAYWDSQHGSMVPVIEDIQRVARDAQTATGAQEMARNVGQRDQLLRSLETFSVLSVLVALGPLYPIPILRAPHKYLIATRPSAMLLPYGGKHLAEQRPLIMTNDKSE